jgi:hypothetical protein
MLVVEGDGWTREIECGRSVAFGRSGEAEVLPLSDDGRLHRQCGVISVAPDGWTIRNTGRWLSIRVSSADRCGVDVLRSGEWLRVPWPSAEVSVCVGAATYGFLARSQVLPVPAAVSPPMSSELTEVPVPIDRSAAYFRALVALCEPMLLDPRSSEVPTDLQVAWRLNRSPLEQRRVTGKTVERRLDTCRARFGLKETTEGTSAGLERRDGRRALVELALRTGTVGHRDLLALDGAELADE